MAARDSLTADDFDSPALQPRGKNYLLAIAINEYEHCTTLNNAVYDVEAFIQLLLSRYHFEEIHITFLKDKEATRKNIEKAFDRLIDLITPEDNLLVYFSGHGRYHPRRGGFWLPVEAKLGHEDWTDYLSNGLIKDYLSKIDCFHTFLIADSCFSGSLFIDKSKEKFSGDRRDTEKSRWGLTSGKKEIVSDGEPGEHSPFSAALLDVFEKADQPLGVMRICDLVLEKVAANAQQTPMGSPLQVPGHQGGQMVFYLRQNEEQDWLEMRSTVKGCKTYLVQYPNGKYRELANQVIIKDQEEKANQAIDEADEKIRRKGENGVKLKFSILAIAGFILVMVIGYNGIQAWSNGEIYFEKETVDPMPPEHPMPLHMRDAIISSIDKNMVHVPGGKFNMGSNEEETDEQPIHQVALNDFYIGKTEVTQEQWRGVMGSDPKLGFKDCALCPVESVNWEDVQKFIHKLNRKTGKNYRLPSEAEWEYAARGGNNSRGFTYAGSQNLEEVAWYTTNSAAKSHPVAQKKANELGLFDMSGNVYEWCQDWYSNKYYSTSPSSSPTGPKSGSFHVIRGGSWFSVMTSTRVADRDLEEPSVRYFAVGFRLARQQ